jgi:hypothetical protein
VTLFLIALACGVTAGRLRGGRLRRLGRMRLRAPVLIGLALVFQVGASLTPRSARLPLVATSYALAGVWLVVNTRRRPAGLRLGLVLLALGWLLNATAMVPNGGMPVSRVALARAGADAATNVEEGHLSKHLTGHARSTAAWLGDVVPVRALGAVVSAGDFVLLAGVALCVAAGMTDRAGVPEPAARSGG